MKLSNADIRIKMVESGIRQWMIAEKLGITEATLSRKMRRELPEAEKNRIFEIMQELEGADE